MKVMIISNPVDVERLATEAVNAGYITFIYDHADPNHALRNEKFLYVHTDEELIEKLNLLKADVTVRDAVR